MCMLYSLRKLKKITDFCCFKLNGNVSHVLQLIWPLLRCVGNLLSSCPVEDLSSQVGDVHLVVALCELVHAYLHSHVALARETAWVLNNLTGPSLTD